MSDFSKQMYSATTSWTPLDVFLLRIEGEIEGSGNGEVAPDCTRESTA